MLNLVLHSVIGKEVPGQAVFGGQRPRDVDVIWYLLLCLLADTMVGADVSRLDGLCCVPSQALCWACGGVSAQVR